MFIVKGGNQCFIQEAKSRMLSENVTSLLQSKYLPYGFNSLFAKGAHGGAWSFLIGKSSGA